MNVRKDDLSQWHTHSRCCESFDSATDVALRFHSGRQTLVILWPMQGMWLVVAFMRNDGSN